MNSDFLVDTLFSRDRIAFLNPDSRREAGISDSTAMSRYGSQCRNDLQRLYAALALFVAGGESSDVMAASLKLDLYDFDAAAFKIMDDCYLLQLNFGTFLAIDDFSGAVAEYYSGEQSSHSLPMLHGMKQKDPSWPLRFVDYQHLVSPGTLDAVKLAPLGGGHAFFGHEEVRSLLSNIMLLWCLAHELAHVALGHLDHFRQHQRLALFKEIDQANESARDTSPGSEERVADANIYYARELHADFLATL